jgi:hypothetical protein
MNMKRHMLIYFFISMVVHKGNEWEVVIKWRYSPVQILKKKLKFNRISFYFILPNQTSQIFSSSHVGHLPSSSMFFILGQCFMLCKAQGYWNLKHLSLSPQVSLILLKPWSSGFTLHLTIRSITIREGVRTYMLWKAAGWVHSQS